MSEDKRHHIDSMLMRESLLDKDVQKSTEVPVFRMLPDAQVIKVSKSGGGSSGPTTTSAAGLVQQSKSDEAVTASDKALQDLNKQTGDDYEKTIQHLPDTIKTEGKPPPKDNQPSGAGTGATVIK